MSDEQFKKSVWDRISAARDECVDLAEEHDELLAKVQGVAAKKTSLELKIANWEELVTGAEGNTNGTTTDTNVDQSAVRRMRLGSKKRVIYQMVADGLTSLEAIEDMLHYSDLHIDERYAREVIRKGMVSLDFAGGLKGEFNITEGGKGILAKAPKPKDWLTWSNLLNEAYRSKSQDDYR